MAHVTIVQTDPAREYGKLTKLGIAGIIILVLLLFVYPVYLLFYAHTVYKHIDKAEAEEVVAHFEKFVETSGHTPERYISFTDHENLSIVIPAKQLKNLPPGTELTILKSPTTNIAIGIYRGSRTLLDYEASLKAIDFERLGLSIVAICFILIIFGLVMAFYRTYSKKHAGLLNIILNARNRDTEYNLKLFNDNTNYTHETNAFGERGTLKSSDGNIHVTFSDSYRDGIYVQVKRYQPWRILLEYSNGTTLIYDDENKHYEPWLKNLVELIEKFRLQKKSKRYLRHFEDLKRRIYESILNSTFKKDFGL